MNSSAKGQDLLLRLLLITLFLSMLVITFAFVGILIYASVVAVHGMAPGVGNNIAGICMGLATLDAFIAVCIWVVGVCVDPFGKEFELEKMKVKNDSLRLGDFPD